MSRRAPYERYKREDIRVAGVTFCNGPEDGGEDRQALLKKLYGEPSLVKLEPCLFFRQETGENEQAIKVRSLLSHKVIGYIPKDHIQGFLRQERMVLQVTLYKGTYGAVLTKPEDPSPKQYGTVMGMVRKGALKRAPYVYDKTAYQWALSQCLATE